jgi:hypothetical protein
VKATVDGKNLSVNVVDGEVDTFTLGMYTITYEATYESETYRLVRHVYVIDETPPVLELNPGVDTLVAGTYEIIYSATDSSDNEGQVSRFVVVMDQE